MLDPQSQIAQEKKSDETLDHEFKETDIKS